MKKINKGIYIAMLLVFVIGIFFYMFSGYIDQMVNGEIQQRLIETANNNVNIVNSLIERDEKYLKGIAQHIIDTNDIDDMEGIQKTIRDSTAFDSFSHVIVFRDNGQIYNEQMEITNTIDVTFDQVSLEEVYSVYTPALGRGLAINVPIKKDGLQVGVLSGVYYNDKMKQLLSYNTFEGEGYFLIINKKGELLFESRKIENLTASSNLFQILDENSFTDGYSYKNMKQNLIENRHFFTAYEVDNITRYAYLVPLGVRDWYVMSAVPAQYLTSAKSNIDGAVLLLIGIMSIIFIALFIIILRLNSKAQKILKSDLDGVKRIMNTVPTPIIFSSKHRVILQMNQSAIDAFTQNGNTIIGRPCNCMNTNVCNTKDCSLERFIGQGIKTTMITHNSIQYMVTTSQMNDEFGQCIGYVEAFQNISEILESKQSLEERTLELETISENLNAGLLITSLEEGFPIIQCNQTYLDLIGEKEENVLGKPATQWLLKADASHVLNDIGDQLRNKGHVYLEHLLSKHEGKELWVSLSGKHGKLHEQNVGIWLLVDISEQRISEQKIRLNEERYRLAVENTEDIIVDFDIVNDIMVHNDRVMELFDVDVTVKHPAKAIVDAGIIAHDYEDRFVQILERLTKGEKKVSGELKAITKYGDEIWLQVVYTTIFDDEGNPIRGIGVMHDVTSEKKTLMNYERELQYRRITMEDAAMSYEVDVTDMIFLSGHEKLTENYAQKETNDFDTVVCLMLEYLVYIEDRDIVFQNTRPEFLKQKLAMGEGKVEFEYRRVLRGNTISWVLCTIHIFQDEISNHIRLIGYIKDIDAAKKQELILKKQAQQDLLTGVFNKVTSHKRIETILSNDNFKFGALAIVDLDNFKNINDSYGHAFGDAVLSEVAQRINQLCGEEAIIGRIGGDEFIVFFTKLTTIQMVEEKVSTLRDMFHIAYTGKHNNYKICGSIGVAVYPKDGSSFEELYGNADIALYSAKDLGKDLFCFYSSNLPAIGSQRLHRIDENSGKQLQENISEYVLRILYEAKNPRLVLNAVLELVARQLHYSRGYVFKKDGSDGYWHCDSEWSVEGIPTQEEIMNHVKFGQDGNYIQYFNENGEFICNDVASLDDDTKDKIKELHIQSFVQIALKREGEIVAFVGFDSCWENISITIQQLEMLHFIAMLIDTYIYQKSLKVMNQKESE